MSKCNVLNILNNLCFQKSDGDKISRSKQCWGHVPSVPSVNDTYGANEVTGHAYCR